MPAVDEAAAPDWIRRHRSVWNAKAGLQRYYRQEYFERILSALPDGPSLEIGAGPGFLAGYHRCTVVTDITATGIADLVADAHVLPFENDSFQAVVGIDVIHHFANPSLALREVARVLRPGGNLILIEPWTTPLARLFYRHVHHEDCFPIQSPWSQVFLGGKSPMDGNAEIPRTYFEALAPALPERCGLAVSEVSVFGLLGYLSTGGFTSLSTPEAVTRLCIRIDRSTPGFLRRLISLKAFIVATKTPKKAVSLELDHDTSKNAVLVSSR